MDKTFKVLLHPQTLLPRILHAPISNIHIISSDPISPIIIDQHSCWSRMNTASSQSLLVYCYTLMFCQPFSFMSLTSSRYGCFCVSMWGSESKVCCGCTCYCWQIQLVVFSSVPAYFSQPSFASDVPLSLLSFCSFPVFSLFPSSPTLASFLPFLKLLESLFSTAIHGYMNNIANTGM